MTAGIPQCGIAAATIDLTKSRSPISCFSPFPQVSGRPMCRNIKILFNFEPPVTDAEIRAASLQFVRKISGFAKPSKCNEAAFLFAVDEIEAASRTLLRSLQTQAPA